MNWINLYFANPLFYSLLHKINNSSEQSERLKQRAPLPGALCVFSIRERSRTGEAEYVENERDGNADRSEYTIKAAEHFKHDKVEANHLQAANKGSKYSPYDNHIANPTLCCGAILPLPV